MIAAGARGRRLGHGCLERGQIQREGRVRPPTERLGRHRDEAIGLWQRLAQPGQQRAEILERLAVGGVRPKRKGQLLARNQGIPLQNQVSQEVLEPRLVEAGDGLVPLQQAERAEQVKVKARCVHLAAIIA